MDISFVSPELRRLDSLRSEALALPFFEDERPLRGALGLVDWRLCGAVSSLILQGRVRGATDEQLLVPVRPKLPFDKLLLFGLGPTSAFGADVFDAGVRRMFDTLSRAHLRAATLALPGRSYGLIEPVRAMERLLEMVVSIDEIDSITVIEDSDAQRVAMPVVELARRRARAQLEA